MCCPHCGNDLRFADPLAKLNPIERELFALLQGRPGVWFSVDQIARIIYADREDGGPLNAHNLVMIYVHRIRNKISSNIIESARGLGYRVPVDIKEILT